MSEDMSSNCSMHDEWLIMKLCMYVGYHDANNVSNFGGDPVTQLSLKTFYSIVYAVLRTWRSRWLPHSGKCVNKANTPISCYNTASYRSCSEQKALRYL